MKISKVLATEELVYLLKASAYKQKQKTKGTEFFYTLSWFLWHKKNNLHLKENNCLQSFSY